MGFPLERRSGKELKLSFRAGKCQIHSVENVGWKFRHWFAFPTSGSGIHPSFSILEIAGINNSLFQFPMIGCFPNCYNYSFFSPVLISSIFPPLNAFVAICCSKLLIFLARSFFWNLANFTAEFCFGAARLPLLIVFWGFLASGDAFGFGLNCFWAIVKTVKTN